MSHTRPILFLILALLPGLEAAAQAQEPTPAATRTAGQKAVAFELASVFPVDDWRDVTGLGAGALLRGDWFVTSDLAVTARAGYAQHLSTSTDGADFSTSEAPFLLGAAYFFGSEPTRFYAAGEMGLVLLHAEIDSSDDALDFSETDAKLGATAGIGLRRGRADVRLTAFAPSITNANRATGILFTVGFTFAR